MTACERCCTGSGGHYRCEPGQQLQIDFVKTKFTFHEENGTAFEQDIYLFEAVYAWSRKSFVRVCPDMTQAHG